MTRVLEILWSAHFLFGLAAGLIGYHCFALGRCRWRNKHRPLPNGERHRVRISRLWVGSLLATVVMVYILAQNAQRATQANECYREFTASIIGYAKISEENDRLSRQHRTLLTQHNDATVDWVNKLVYPPPEIAALPQNDSRRLLWFTDLTRSYFAHIQDLTRRMREVEDRQNDLEQFRNEHPIEKLRCGVADG